RRLANVVGTAWCPSVGWTVDAASGVGRAPTLQCSLTWGGLAWARRLLDDSGFRQPADLYTYDAPAAQRTPRLACRAGHRSHPAPKRSLLHRRRGDGDKRRWRMGP